MHHVAARLLLPAVAAAALAAADAGAWKPKTHVYLSEEAVRDAVDDGRVTIREVDPATNRPTGALGSFEVDPKVLHALRAAMKQFRAGVVGPDAFPDIVTGQTVIHPQEAAATGGSADGSDAWLTHVWQRGYQASDAPEVNAFALGYLAHAAGDVFAHTFVNHYAGGEFLMLPDPSNAIKHLTLEGYLGKRTPATVGAIATATMQRGGVCNRRKADDLGVEQDCSAKVAYVNLPVTQEDTSIAGVERFILDEMVQVTPGSVLRDKLYKGEGTAKSLPFIFSTLRAGLAAEVAAYDRQRMELRGPARLSFSTANGPAAEYKRAWITDIDAGLAALPAFSQRMSKALVYNEAGADMAGARAAVDDYSRDHLLKMAGVPDGAVMTAAAIGAITSHILPPPLREALGQLSRAPFDLLVTASTGMTPQQIGGYVTYPERHFDDVMTTNRGASGGEVPHPVRLADVNRDILKLADAGFNDPAQRWKIDDLPAAFDTVQLIKLMMLSPAGFRALKGALAVRGAAIDVPDRNVILGWVTSLDRGNQWQGQPTRTGASAGRPIFTRAGGAAYDRLFMKIVGEKPLADAASPPPAPAHGGTHAATPVDGDDWLPPALPKSPPAGHGAPADDWLPPVPAGAPAGRATGSAPPGSGPATVPAPARDYALGSDLGGGMLVIDTSWAARLDRFERQPNGDVHVFMTMRNLRLSSIYLSPGSFEPLLLNAQGEGITNRGIYRATGEATIFTPIVPAGAEVHMRYVMSPAKDFGKPVRFTLEGHDSGRPLYKPIPWPVPDLPAR